MWSISLFKGFLVHMVTSDDCDKQGILEFQRFNVAGSRAEYMGSKVNYTDPIVGLLLRKSQKSRSISHTSGYTYFASQQKSKAQQGFKSPSGKSKGNAAGPRESPTVASCFARRLRSQWLKSLAWLNLGYPTFHPLRFVEPEQKDSEAARTTHADTLVI